MYFYGFFKTDVLIFSCRLGWLKRLHGKISSQQNGIPALQKRDPGLPG